MQPDYQPPGESRYSLLDGGGYPAQPGPADRPAPPVSPARPVPPPRSAPPDAGRAWGEPPPARSAPPEPGRRRAEPAPLGEAQPPAEQPPGRPESGRGWSDPSRAEPDRTWSEPAARPPDPRRPGPAGAGRSAPPVPPPRSATGSAAVGTAQPGVARVGPPMGPPGAPPAGMGPPGAPPVGMAPPGAPPLGTAPPGAPPVGTAPPGAPGIPTQGRGTAEPGYARTAPRRRAQPDPETQRATGILGRDIDRPRVIAFANPKGGVHKTTATVLAAATIGSVRGRGVLAWDDNELRGTLGLRAGSARHARTIRHLVADLMMIEASSGTALYERLDDYLRHASDGSYDVLAGEENSRFASRLDQHTVGRVLDLLRRTHNVICVDTGNNVESANWQTVLRAADQLVVTTVPREDAAFTADWMLDLLHEIGMGELVENAVTLLSCPTPGRSPLLDDLQRHFATRTRAVAVVPYDAALETGSSIEYAQLQPDTREAWLQAAAAMVEPFVR
ncbi:AAA family ATPase [Plantactinospora sp. KBS50]|uniref:AAA family ATPase n=1 Tax=Plantactinospora sp. KBS50 TaxID=2024580 RepID=UPI0035126418